MFRIPVQSSIQTWLRGSLSCSCFLRAVTFVEEFLQCFRGKELEAP